MAVLPKHLLVRSVGVVDEWSIMRTGIEALVRRCGLTVVRSVATATGLMAPRTVRARALDLVVIGQVADMSQAALVARVAAAHPHARIVCLAVQTSPAAVVELCAQGAHAVVARSADDADLVAALRSLQEGRRHMAPGLLDAMFAAPERGRATPVSDLTVREREVLEQLAAGRTNSEIGERLLIGAETVKSHLTNIYAKLDVRRRSQAVRVAMSHGLV
jgi:DNA-binding NarL/FixJ family response regulator